MNEITLVLGNLTALRPRFLQAWNLANDALKAGLTLELVLRERKTKRNSEQNKKLNAMCGDLAEQVLWHGQALHKDDWRHMFVAAYRKEQRIVPGINGGFVVLGASSRRLSVPECSDVIEMLYAFGAEHGVVWTDPKNLPLDEQWDESRMARAA